MLSFPIYLFKLKKNTLRIVYLNSKSTARNIQLIFGIGSAPTIDRSWRMKISLLPCDADYLGKMIISNLSLLLWHFKIKTHLKNSSAQLSTVHHGKYGYR